MRTWQPWIVVLSASLFFFFEFFQANMFNALRPHLMEALSLSPSQFGLLSSLHLWGTLLLIFPGGLLLDRYSVRHIMLAGLALALLGTFLFSLQHDFAGAAAFRVMVGMAAGPVCGVGSLKLASRWFDARRLPLAMGLVIMIAMLGGLAAQMPMHYLAEHYGWRMALRADVAMGVLFWCVMWLNLKNHPKHTPGPVMAASPSPDQDDNLSVRERFAAVLRNKNNWFVAVYASLTNLPLPLLGSLFANQFLAHQFGHSTAEAAFITSWLYLGMALGAPFVGFVAGRWGSLKKPMMVGVVGNLALLSILLSGMHCSVLGASVLFALMGLSTSMHTLLYPYLATTNPSYATATATSLGVMMIMLAAASAQPFLGYLVEHFSHADTLLGQATPYLLLPACMLVALLALLPLADHKSA